MKISINSTKNCLRKKLFRQVVILIRKKNNH